MFLVNTSTKKFVDSASLDLGLLPADGKITIQLTDGTAPVIAEGKTFAMTIGSITPTLYKTDDDTVSFRYIHFDDENVATTMAITLEMDGVEVLDDTIALTYTEAGGGDPFPQGGYAGDFLQKTENGQTWAEVPAELPSATSSDSGKVLTVDSSGSPEWANAQYADNSINYLCLNGGKIKVDKIGSPDPINLQYSYDTKTWFDYTWEGNEGELVEGDTIYLRGENTSHFSKNESNLYHIFSNGIYSGNLCTLISYKNAYPNVPANAFIELFSTTWDRYDGTNHSTSVYVAPDIKCLNAYDNSFLRMFKGNSSLYKPGKIEVSFVKSSTFRQMFLNCTSLSTAPDILNISSSEFINLSEMYKNCVKLVVGPKIVITQSNGERLSEMFSGCEKLTTFSFTVVRRDGSNNNYTNMFANCGNLSDVYFYDYGFYATPNQLVFPHERVRLWTNLGLAPSQYQVPRPTVFAPSTLLASDWTETNSDKPSYVLNKGISNEVAVSDATYTVNAGTTVPLITVSSALTLSASTVDVGKIAYAEVVLDIDANATVTAGTNLTLVDTLTAGKRNICVVRWSGGTAKLYVTITEDLPSSSSSSASA